MCLQGVSLSSQSRSASEEDREVVDGGSSMWRNVKSIATMLMEDPEVVEERATGPIVEGVDFKLGRIQFGLMYDFQNLTLTLRIIRAVDLPAKDVTGTSDPYVKILLLPDKKHKLLTKVKKRNLNPHWNECFLFEGEVDIHVCSSYHFPVLGVFLFIYSLKVENVGVERVFTQN